MILGYRVPSPKEILCNETSARTKILPPLPPKAFLVSWSTEFSTQFRQTMSVNYGFRVDWRVALLVLRRVARDRRLVDQTSRLRYLTTEWYLLSQGS